MQTFTKTLMQTLIEKAKAVKIIFFDIDDTLRAKDTKYLPESVPQAFEKLKNAGILTGIATGRSLYGVVPEVRALQPDFFVTINGAYVENAQHEVVYEHCFPTQLIEDIIAWLESEKSEYAFVGKEKVAISRWNQTAENALQIVYNTLPEDKLFYRSHSVYQMLTISDHDRALKLPEALADKIRLVRWHEHSSDIVPFTGSKAEGVKKIMEKLGFSAANVMNFGDEMNDKELFELSGLSVAMKKSHPEILQMADYITDTVENDGVYKALQALKII